MPEDTTPPPDTEAVINRAAELINLIYQHEPTGTPLHTEIDGWNIGGVWELRHGPHDLNDFDSWDRAVELAAIMNGLGLKDRETAMNQAELQRQGPDEDDRATRRAIIHGWGGAKGEYADGWLWALIYEMKASCPGLTLSLHPVPGGVALRILRVPVHLRGRGHAPRIMRRILAETDARGLAVVCTPTSEYGANRAALVRALTRAGFRDSPADSTEHTMRRPPAGPTLRHVRRGPGGAVDFYDTATGQRVGSGAWFGDQVQWSGLDGAGGYASDLDTAGVALAQHVADRRRDHTDHQVVLAPYGEGAFVVTCRTCSPNVELLHADGALTFAELAAVVRGEQGDTDS